MRRYRFVCAMIFGWFGASAALAHECGHYDHHYSEDSCNNGSHDCRPGTSGQLWNPVEQRAIEGKITEVMYLAGETPETGMVEVRLLAGERISLVRLGPAGILKGSGMHFREGESLSVKGFLVSGADGNIVIATEIRQGDKTLRLRDLRGRSVW